jgi:hypothetical protein
VQAREDLKDLVMDGRFILKSTFSKFGGVVWTGFILAQDRNQWLAFTYEYGNEH